MLNVQLDQQKHQRRPPKNMVSITKYELIEKPDKGVF